VPTDDGKLAEVLLAIGCTMTGEGEERQVVLRLHGWTNFGATTVSVHMDKLRRMLPAAVKSVGALHEHMRLNIDLSGRPDWERIPLLCTAG